MPATWRVGAVVKETVEDTLRFAAWYLEAGATGITLMMDDPDDAAIPILQTRPEIEVIPMTRKMWEQIGFDADRPFIRRQNFACTWCYRNMYEDWFLNVDADEFLFSKT